jgi:hypothetical protein
MIVRQIVTEHGDSLGLGSAPSRLICAPVPADRRAGGAEQNRKIVRRGL